MVKYTIGKIAEIVQGTLIGDPETEVEGVAIDSRLIKDNELFVPIKGERVDGHTFVKGLFEKGIKVSFWQDGTEEMPENGNIILVDDNLKALQKLAAQYRKDLGVRIVGVTGSSGKTSTKDLIASVLSQKYRVLKTDGNKNNDIGVPLTLLSINSDIEVAVIEMGILDFGIMDNLVEMVRPDHTVITSIAPAHIMRFKTMDNIVQQKCLINKYLDEGICFYNHDTYGLADYLPTMNLRNSPVGYGFNANSNVVITPGNFDASGMTFSISEYPEEEYSVPLLGMHQLLNSTAAVLVGKKLGLTYEEIRTGLQNVQLTPHRRQMIKINDSIVIDDTYNSNPGSLCASLEMLSSLKTDYKKCVCLGDMLELGDNEAEFHASIADIVDFSVFREIMLYGNLMKNLHERLKIKNIESEYYEDKKLMLDDLKTLLKERVIILFKASNGLRFMDLIKDLEDFYEC
ncbi:MAG: UDP-N-acetylmuramoyl-tripeptide--D-alanyl-D-alanine ligase [Erysipelotrichaceae bacterium]|nr:UDP-N-acetylmuramoyl-tripeptide--D-alanyl-D-alanine ligase [Erysipelotrichaceae bacterium]